MRARREMEIIAGQVNTGTGVITQGTGDFTVTGSGGAMVVFLPKDFKLVAVSGNASAIVMFDNFTKASFRIVTVNSVGGGAVPVECWFIAVGYRQ